MIVLAVHNYYQQPGGEDAVFRDETALMESHGHTVIRHTVHNDAVEQLGKLRLARKTLWNQDSYDEIRSLIRQHRPDVAHFHNTFPLLSPAVYHAAKDEGVGVVQTLHNFRLLCPAATFFRDGHVCEDCMHTATPWPAVWHACYRDNRAASGMSAAMLSYHRLKRTWREKVDVYVALTRFSRDKFVQGGLPGDKIVIKPNFLASDPGEGKGEGGYAVFVGRLTVEKGIPTLLKTWQQFNPSVPLQIAGDGPLRSLVENAARQNPKIKYLGRKAPADVHAIIGSALILIFCSEWYETFGLTIVEALANGTPVVASRIGGIPELVNDGVTGLLFEPGNAADLASKIEQAVNADKLRNMRKQCRHVFLSNYTAAQNYPMLNEVYVRAIGATASQSGSACAHLPD